MYDRTFDRIMSSGVYKYVVYHEGDFLFTSADPWALVKYLVHRDDDIMEYKVVCTRLDNSFIKARRAFIVSTKYIIQYAPMLDSMQDWWLTHIMDCIFTLHGYPISSTWIDAGHDRYGEVLWQSVKSLVKQQVFKQ